TLLVALVLPTTARATPSARLVYARDADSENCPDEGALRSAVASRLGYDPFFPYAKATLFAEIERVGTTYRARVRLVDDGNIVRGARDLMHGTARCADLVDAMALTMSIAIDPRSLAGPIAAPAQSVERVRVDDATPASTTSERDVEV